MCNLYIYWCNIICIFLQNSDGCDVPSLQVLDKLSKEIIPFWESLGRHLHVEESTIESITFSLQHVAPEQKAFQLLKAWRNMGNSSTYERLADALRNLDQGRIVGKLSSWQKQENTWYVFLLSTLQTEIKQNYQSCFVCLGT